MTGLTQVASFSFAHRNKGFVYLCDYDMCIDTLFRQACKENIFMAQFQFCAMKRGSEVCCPEQR